MELVLAFAVLGVLVFGWRAFTRENEQRGIAIGKAQNQAYVEFEGILETQFGIVHPEYCLSRWTHEAIAYDAVTGRVAFGRRIPTGNLHVEVFEPGQIRKCSIDIDGTSVIETSFSETAARAFAGGLLFGEAGTVVGALASSRQVREKVRSVVLNVLVDDPSQPRRQVTFFAITDGNGVDAFIADAAMRYGCGNPREWYDRLTVLMERGRQR
jgi:hypothetical protein